jgi:hypothetical protein
MKKTIGLLAILFVAIITVTACGGKKTAPKQSSVASKSKVTQKTSGSVSTSSTVSETDNQSSETVSSETPHGGSAEESKWSEQASEAAKIMTVAEARQILRDSNIDDSNFSNADINSYLLDAQKAGQDFKTYMSAQGFPTLN